VIGIAASGTTPYVLGALRTARDAGSLTLGIASNPDTPLLGIVRHPILLETGSEAIAGSTRMKAGTAQKIVLNLFSTTIMVKLGRVYRGLMVHMRATNAKLRRRAEAIVRALSQCTDEEAAHFVEAANGSVKLAVLLAHGAGADEASRLLEQHGENLRAALRAFGIRHA
jgi:N-acetylmuramic acid 6-phosphate etherase